MKYLLTMVLALIVSVPVVAQRHQGKRTHDRAKVEKHEDKKGCSKCAALKKQVAGMRKRMAEVMKEKKAASKGRGSRGKRGFQRSSFRGRSDRSGSKRSTSRRSRTRNVPPTKKAKDAKEMNDVRKKWEDMLKKRLKGTSIESRKIDWRKVAQSKK